MKIAKLAGVIIRFAVVSNLTLGLGVAWAQQKEDTPGRLGFSALEKFPEFGFPKGKTVHVDATIGRDLPQCGTQQTPCLTISQGLNRARQIQDSPVAPDDPMWTDTTQTGVTVKVGPGTYNESITITSKYISLRGAGPGSSIITAQTIPSPYAAFIRANPVLINGFTIKSNSSYGVFVGAGVNAYLANCEFVDSFGGLYAEHAQVYVTQSLFNNNRWGVVAMDSSVVRLDNVNNTGQGTNVGAGIWAQNRSVVLLESSARRAHSITNYRYGVFAENSTINILRYQISNNENGVYAVSKALVWLDYGTAVTDNSGWGARGTGDTFLHVVGDVKISENGGGSFGIWLQDFARCIIQGQNEILDKIIKDDSSDFRIR
jgi:hypothetical protein